LKAVAHETDYADKLLSHTKNAYLTVILAAPIVWKPLFEANVFSFAKRTRGRSRALDARVIARAREALARDEVPIGACVVAGDQLLAVAGNRTRTDCDPTAHAEIVALRAAARKLGNYRLAEAVIYSTSNPAPCVPVPDPGAREVARVWRTDGTQPEPDRIFHFHICDSDQLNHRVEVIKGVCEAECRDLMQEFFRIRRQK